jgi:hypothetical protein
MLIIIVIDRQPTERLHSSDFGGNLPSIYQSHTNDQADANSRMTFLFLFLIPHQIK